MERTQQQKEQQIFSVLKYRKNKNELQDYMNANKEYFTRVDMETYQASRIE